MFQSIASFVVAAALLAGNVQAAPLPPIAAVKTDDAGRLVVNGKPFFPILLYDAPTDDATLAKLSDFGFNTLTVGTGKDAAALLAHGFYGAIHVSAKVTDTSGVLLANGIDSPVLSFPTDTIAKTIAANKAVAANCPGRPVISAIGYWLNEPAGVIAGTLPGKDKYEDLVSALDIAGPYLYPVPYQPVSTVGDAVARAHAATGGKKMVLPILQLFTWDEKSRYPTPAELRCMVYLSLAEGANGIGYYTYNSVDKSPKHPIPAELWDSVKPLNKEIAEVGQFLITAKPSDALSTSIRGRMVFKLRAAEHGKDGMLVVVNPKDKKQTEKLAFAHDISNVSGAKVEATKRDITLTLDPYEAVVLRYQVGK